MRHLLLNHKRGHTMMTKGDLIAKVYAGLDDGLSKTATGRAVNAVLESIAEGLETEGEVRIGGFGTFRVKDRGPRKGRNPQTGETMHIPASRYVAFKAASALKGRMQV